MKAINRVFEYLENQGIPHTRFEKDIGLSNGYLKTQLKRDGDLGEGVLNKIIDNSLHLNPAWLLTGEGKMILDNQVQEDSVQYYKLRGDKNVELQHIPLYNIEATAGLVTLFDNMKSQNAIDYISIPNVSRCDGACFITGDSMYPILKSGDIVAFKKLTDFKNDVFWGEMYLISVEVAGEEYVSVKYIQKSEKGSNYIRLVSHNGNHQDKEVHLNKVRAMAYVKASIRIHSMQ